MLTTTYRVHRYLWTAAIIQEYESYCVEPLTPTRAIHTIVCIRVCIPILLLHKNTDHDEIPT